MCNWCPCVRVQKDDVEQIRPESKTKPATKTEVQPLEMKEMESPRIQNFVGDEASSLHRISKAAKRSFSFSSMPVKKSPKILLAEDNPIIQKSLGQLLRSALNLEEGDLDVASDGKEAADLVAVKKFDLIVTDFEMPSPNGIALTRMIKSPENQKGLNAQTPIVVCSATDNPLTPEELIQSGMSAWVPKSISRKDLAKLGKECLPEFY